MIYAALEASEINFIFVYFVNSALYENAIWYNIIVPCAYFKILIF
jgi:hypothetical protein